MTAPLERIVDSFPRHTPARPSVPGNEVHAGAHKDTGQAVATGETAFCHRCGRETRTILLPLRSGHIGRVCEVCRTCRRGRPYAKRSEYEARNLHAAERQEVEAHVPPAS